MKQKILHLETLSNTSQGRNLYKEMDWFRKGYQARLNGCKDKNGCVVDKEKILERWTEHIEEVLNEREEQQNNEFEVVNGVVKEDGEIAEHYIAVLEGNNGLEKKIKLQGRMA